MANNKGLELDQQGRRQTLAPTALAQYLKQDSCDRFLRFYLHKGETDALARRFSQLGLQRALQPFGPLLAELGDRIESGVINRMRAQGHIVIDLDGQDTMATLAAIKKATAQPVYLYQAQVAGKLGQWQFEGRADLLRVKCAAERLEILVGDVKSTRKDKVFHRLQVAIYVKMLQYVLGEAGMSADFLGTVVRRNLDGTLQDPDSAPQFDLAPYFAALDQLAVSEDSALARVDAAQLEDLHYYIDQKCDGCLFNPVCLVESAERQDIALIPFVESADKRALTEYGIRTIPQLARLKRLPTPSTSEDGATSVQDRRILPAPGREKLVAALAEKWPVGSKLDRLVQRAVRMGHRFDPDNSQPGYGYFFDAGRSTLPDERTYPDLVKIFLDVQTDYMEDRVYLAGARVVGPKGSESVVQMTPGVPTAESERAMLVRWVADILTAVLMVAEDASAAPVHLYLYNRHDQRFLLEALRRHLDVFASLPALYDLLTETPALTQSAVSFVYDEVKERRNLASTGHTLQAVATQLGFKWNDGDNVLYYRLFEYGMFDYLLRRQDNGRYIESAARFYSTIPLEYAYAAWGLFKAEDFRPTQRRDVTPFLRVNTEHIRQFQAKRLEALAYIESNFKFKNAYIKKEPLDLVALGTISRQSPPFRRVLEEFLYIEHYANLQDHLQLFSQPIVKRVQQGRALLVRCLEVQDSFFRNKQATAVRFEADFSETGLEPSAALQLNKIKSGDFVVLNRLDTDGRAWETVRGRLAVVRSLEGAVITLDLSDMTFFNNNKDGRGKVDFRYSHDNKLRPEEGQFYTIDEMVDDLNGDKLLEGCRNADFNPFYHLLAAPYPAENNQRHIPLQESDKAAEFATLLASLDRVSTPTASQQAVIAGHLDEKIFLVQGPPGTGKSHTLGWAVLARMFAARAGADRPLRVAVSCQTHNAVNIVLQSIAGKLARLQGTVAWPWLENLHLYKVGEESEDNTSAGVERLDPWEYRSRLSQVLYSQLVVIGATPGGLHKLMKQQTKNARNSEAMWQEKPFDLLILDEASQMNLPQAVLASSWLREDGQMIVVGDHRQMAPILAHSWDEEDRLSAVETQPYRSVFKYLLDRQFPRLALDESFRLHRLQAEFLQDIIYQYDGIIFHSRRQQLLPELDDIDTAPYLKAVLDPRYPIVIVQHAERGSQQANPTEAALITPLVEACTGRLGLSASEGVGVVVPHRAQKALLRAKLPGLAASDAIDTVERFQGGEREVIIVSATASDPDYVLAEAEFLLNPNRLNVALSRPRKKLIVVASSVVFNFLSSDLEIFDQAVLWKRLLAQCSGKLLWSGPYAGTTVKVFGCSEERT